MCEAAYTAITTAEGVAFDGSAGAVTLAGYDACGTEIQTIYDEAKTAADALGALGLDISALVPDVYSDGYHIGIRYQWTLTERGNNQSAGVCIH